MKKNVFMKGILGLALVFGLVFSGCDDSSDGGTPNGYPGDNGNTALAVINLSQTWNARSAYLDELKVKTAKYRLQISKDGSSGESVHDSTVPVTQSSIEISLSPGYYYFTLQALDSASQVLASGYISTTLVSGRNNVTITFTVMAPETTEANANIDVNWQENIMIRGTSNYVIHGNASGYVRLVTTDSNNNGNSAYVNNNVWSLQWSNAKKTPTQATLQALIYYSGYGDLSDYLLGTVSIDVSDEHIYDVDLGSYEIFVMDGTCAFSNYPYSLVIKAYRDSNYTDEIGSKWISTYYSYDGQSYSKRWAIVLPSGGFPTETTVYFRAEVQPASSSDSITYVTAGSAVVSNDTLTNRIDLGIISW